MHNVHIAEQLQHHRAAAIVREAELMRRIAERQSADAAPVRPELTVASKMTTRFRALLAQLSHRGRPVVGH